jgi:sigma-B regulation protein RsbU (phosphoserine phosphatase)
MPDTSPDAQAQRFQEELELARIVQRNLLPLPLPTRDGVELAARYEPIDALGGDFFDIVDLGQGASGFFLADVVGHGTSAALFTSFLKAQLLHWSLLMQKETPGETLTDMNLALGKVFGGTGRFVTALYATFEPGIERLHFSNAGHPSPLYVPREGEAYLLEGAEVPLGVLADTQYQTREVRFAPGDRIYFFTDGITDQVGPGSHESFGRGRLAQVLVDARERPLADGVDRLVTAVTDWRGEVDQADDMNVLAIEARDLPA